MVELGSELQHGVTAMSTKNYIIDLTEAEQGELEGLIHHGKSPARTQTRARILLKAAVGYPDSKIAAELGCGLSTVERTRKRFVVEGLAAAIHDRPHPGTQPKLSPAQTAHLTALACSPAPGGRKAWTLRLLADKMVELAVVESLSYETVRQVMKKKSAQALAN